MATTKVGGRRQLLTRQARQPRKALALGHHLVLRAGELQRCIRIERLLSHLRQLAEIARAHHSLGQIVRGVGRLLHLLDVADQFLRSHRAEEGLSHLRCDADRVVGCPQPCLVGMWPKPKGNRAAVALAARGHFTPPWDRWPLPWGCAGAKEISLARGWAGASKGRHSARAPADAMR